METKQTSNNNEQGKTSLSGVNDNFYMGQKVRTIHDKEGEIVGIYDGKYPYVVCKIRDGKAYLSDYSSKQITPL